MDKIAWLGLPVKTWVMIGIPFFISALAPILIALYLIKTGRVDRHE